MVTVGLNPSLHEFPSNKPFLRFPLAGDTGDREPDQYLDAMSAYFRTEPYSSWFGAFEPLLNGAESSYYAGGRPRPRFTPTSARPSPQIQHGTT